MNRNTKILIAMGIFTFLPGLLKAVKDFGSFEPLDQSNTNASDVLGEQDWINAALQGLGAGSSTNIDSVAIIYYEFNKQGYSDPNQLAYILATAWHESRLGELMTEIASGQQYEFNAMLGNTQVGDGVKFKGRGYVQITGRRNYTLFGKLLGLDLINNPNLVTEQQYAAKIIVDGMMKGIFTGVSIPRYINSDKVDFFNARRTVNITDRASLIQGYANSILNSILNSSQTA